MRSWRGMIQPEELLEDLLQFMDSSPRDHHFTLSNKRKRENSQSPPSKIQATQDHARAVARNGKSEEDKDTQLAQASSIETTVVDSFVEPSKALDAVNTENEIPKSEITYPPLPEEPKGDRSLLCRVGVRLPDGRRLQRNFLRSDPIQLLWSFCHANLEGSDEKPFRLTNAIPDCCGEVVSCSDFEAVLLRWLWVFLLVTMVLLVLYKMNLDNYKKPRVLVTCRSMLGLIKTIKELISGTQRESLFRREEFCLVTGVRFGVEYWVDYNNEDDHIPFRRRVFSSVKDGLEDRRGIPDWILRLANYRDGWDKYP
nr:hypothetical protein [Tanacetum cinerariifolium]